MNENSLEQKLVDVKAFNVLEQPVIVTSGESLTPFFVNTEKLLEDGGAWKSISDVRFDEEGNKTNDESGKKDAVELYFHSQRQYETSPAFKQTVDSLVEKVKELKGDDHIAIAGGETRDWPFAGIVAQKLGLDYIVLHKDGDADLIEHGDENLFIRGLPTQRYVNDLSDRGYDKVITVVDLITTGSSVYTNNDGTETGWVPMLKQRGVEVEDVVSVVSRGQGGEEFLKEAGLNAHVLVTLDDDFFARNITGEDDLANCKAYRQDSRAWTEQYLLNSNGLDILLDTFDPQSGKAPRAVKFVNNYKKFLEENDLFDSLATRFEERYGAKLEDQLN